MASRYGNGGDFCAAELRTRFIDVKVPNLTIFREWANTLKLFRDPFDTGSNPTGHNEMFLNYIVATAATTLAIEWIMAALENRRAD